MLRTLLVFVYSCQLHVVNVFMIALAADHAPRLYKSCGLLANDSGVGVLNAMATNGWQPDLLQNEPHSTVGTQTGKTRDGVSFSINLSLFYRICVASSKL